MFAAAVQDSIFPGLWRLECEKKHYELKKRETGLNTCFAIDNSGHLLGLWGNSRALGPHHLGNAPAEELTFPWDSIVVSQPQFEAGIRGHTAEVIASSREVNAAIFRITTPGIETHPVPLARMWSTVSYGSSCAAFGYPMFDPLLQLPSGIPCVTAGIVASKVTAPKWQDTRPVRFYVMEIHGMHGYCGAPAFLPDGSVIGMFNAGGMLSLSAGPDRTHQDPGLAIALEEFQDLIEGAGIKANWLC